MAVELPQVTSITDFLQTDHFTLELPFIPGGGDKEAFMIRNLTGVLPGKGNKIVAADIHRFTIQRAGPPVFNKQFVANWMDTPDKKILDGIYNWQAACTDPETGLPRPGAEYLSTGIIVVYDMANQPIERRVFNNLWLGSVADIPLNGASGGMMQLALTLVYDSWDRM